MPNPIGVSFAPTFDDSRMSRSQGQGGTAPGAARPQEALQVLSYRLPRVLSASAISPLLSDSMRGSPNMGVLESIMRTILGDDEANAILGGSMPTSTPAFHPGAGAPPPPSAGGFEPLPGPHVPPSDFPTGGPPGWEELPPQGRIDVPPGPVPLPYDGNPWSETRPESRDWLRGSGAANRNPFAY